MTPEANVSHGPLPSAAYGNTASPTPCGGDEKLEDRSLAYPAVSRERRERNHREEDKEAAVRSDRRGHSTRSSFPYMYRDIIKSVLSHVMTTNEASASTPSSSPRGRDKTGIKDKQVEDVVRGLAMEEWNTRWLDELVAKVKGELVTDGLEHGDDASDRSVSDDGPPTPLSQSSGDDAASLKSSMKRYQPTVEDYDEEEDDASDFGSQAAAHDNALQPLSRTSSQLSSRSSTDSSFDSPSSHSSASSTSSSYTALSSSSPAPKESHRHSPSPSHSPPPVQPPSPRPTVHFSDKQPPVIHYTTEPPEPEPEAQPEPEPELYRTHSLPSHLRAPIPERQAPPYVHPKWKPLFNERDEPTPALGRFLRGLANYIIAEYAPTDSLVITPDKLFKFYTRYKLDNEFFPFQRVFDTRYQKSLRGLSFLFSDLRCQHHLVQESITSKPIIPSLTPAGFEDWMTLLIRAFPDREAKRLDLILADIPLLADDKNNRSPVGPCLGERLPRKLPRDLFPERGHARAFDLLASSFSEWNSITTVVVPPPGPPPGAPPASLPHAYTALSSNMPPSLQKLPPAASKALKEDTRRHKDACYIDQSRLRPTSAAYSSSPSPSSPSSSSFSASSASAASPESNKPHADQQSSGSGSGSSSKHHRPSRSRERDSRHRNASDRSSRRSRETSPPPSSSSSGRRHHKSRRYRDTSPSDSPEQRWNCARGDERRRERERERERERRDRGSG
ncbi:hypothetical protein V8C37DRAFT_312792 [Trichoderma ceciliae]